MNNKGFSLVELIVTIAIMTIVTGTISMGINIMFSKDAEKCATRLNDEIYTARMESMSKIGSYTLTVKTDGDGKCIAEVNKAGETKTVYLDGPDGKKTTIDVVFIDETGSEQTLTMPVTFSFDKSKGSVNSITASGASYTGTVTGILCFNINAISGNRNSKVQIVTSTGKHTVGEFR